MSENDSDLGAFLAGFVIGGLVGAATALILAPQSGVDTRSRIAEKSRELRDSGEERVQQYRQMADNYAQEYRGRAGDALASARSRVEDTGGSLQDQARIVLDSGKQRVTQVKDQVGTMGKQEGEHNIIADEGDEAAATV